jgi:O-antigen/teichoic acid export membrane protein
VTASNAVIFLSTEADKFLVSRYFGPTSLGFYTLAAKVASIPRIIGAELVSRVALPTFAKLQTDPERLRRTYAKVETVMICVSGVIAVTVAIAAYPAVHLVLGDKWAPMVGFLFVLPFAEAIRAVTIVGGELYYACDQPHYRFYLNAIRFGVLLVAAWILSAMFGIMGIAIAVVVSNIVVWPFYRLWLRRSIDAGQAAQKPLSSVATANG